MKNTKTVSASIKMTTEEALMKINFIKYQKETLVKLDSQLEKARDIVYSLTAFEEGEKKRFDDFSREACKLAVFVKSKFYSLQQKIEKIEADIIIVPKPKPKKKKLITGKK